MLNLQKIDNSIKEIRKDLYKKYSEEFKKNNEGLHKSSELSTSIEIIINEMQSISLNYNNYFDLDDYSSILYEKPDIFIGEINPMLYKDIMKLKYIQKIFIDENIGNVILVQLGFNISKIQGLVNDFITYKHELNRMFGEEGQTDDEIKNEFYNEELYDIINKRIFYVEYSELKDLEHFDLQSILDQKNKQIEVINEVFGLKKHNQIFSINNIEIHNINIEIYSYVFGEGRIHLWKGDNIEEITKEIKKDISNW